MFLLIPVRKDVRFRGAGEFRRAWSGSGTGYSVVMEFVSKCVIVSKPWRACRVRVGERIVRDIL